MTISPELHHTLVLGGLTVYFLWGVRITLLGMLRLFLGIQLLGDLLFGDLWTLVPTYAFALNLEQSDRTLAAETWGLAMLLCLVGYHLVRGTIAQLQPAEAPADQGTVDGDPSRDPARHHVRLGGVVLLLGILCKLAFLASVGILFGGRSVASLRPEDSLGVSAIMSIGDFLLPLGLVLWRPERRTSWTLARDIAVLAVSSYLSFSKAGILTYLFYYCSAFVFAFGMRRARRDFIGWRSVVLFVLVLANIAIKSQQRASSTTAITQGNVVMSIVGGGSARFMGGIFRTHAIVNREVMRYGAPTMGGRYHEQFAYLWVPRALWPGKPRVASEELYYILGVSEEEPGTAFAVSTFGFFLLDFGFRGMLVASAIFGMVLGVGDTVIARVRRATSGSSDVAVFWATGWVSCAFALSESGVPIAFNWLLMLSGVFTALLALAFTSRGLAGMLSVSPALARPRVASPGSP